MTKKFLMTLLYWNTSVYIFFFLQGKVQHTVLFSDCGPPEAFPSHARKNSTLAIASVTIYVFRQLWPWQGLPPVHRSQCSLSAWAWLQISGWFALKLQFSNGIPVLVSLQSPSLFIYLCIHIYVYPLIHNEGIIIS